MADGLAFRLKRRFREVSARFNRSFVVQSRLRRPVLSLTFDDCPHSAVTTGAEVLNGHGVRGTFYLAGSFMGSSADGLPAYGAEDVIRLSAAGHELGCHSFGHIRLPDHPDDRIAADLAENAAALGRPLVSHAFPFGEISPRAKALVGARFQSARGIVPGLNAGAIDMAQLKAVPLERRSLDHDHVQALIQRAVAETGWLILFSHDVSDDPSPYGCTAGDLDRVVRAAISAGLTILPVHEATQAARLGH